VALTSAGETQAQALGELLAGRPLAHVLASPAIRAWRTAELAGLDTAEKEPALWEWDYGGYEGRTSEEIREERPGWYLWTDGVIPGDAEHPGESIEQVGSRVDAVLDRVRTMLKDGDVALVAHGHVLRILTARWLGLEPNAGRLFRLDTGTVSELGTEHGRSVIDAWNVPVPS
jgi:probable phosphoglycerate mutase